MREILETIRDQLKRMSAEGVESIVLDDESRQILARLASDCLRETYSSAKSATQTAHFPASVSSAAADLRAKARAEFVDNVKEVEFVKDLASAELKFSKNEMKKKSVSVVGGFKIAPIPDPKPFTLPDGDKRTRWEYLKNLVVNDPVCNAHLKPEKHVVFGVGNLDAKIFFCGEAPGADEEIQAEPFVGRAGQLLTKIISAMGLKREDVYIGNIMNWRPELPTSRGNRPPEPVEMAYCLPYLKAQIEIVRPQVIVALGGTATKGLLGDDPNRKMGKVRGTWNKFEGTDLMITYHPSYLLQYATPAIKRLVWEDMMKVMERVGLPISEKQRAYFLPKGA